MHIYKITCFVVVDEYTILNRLLNTMTMATAVSYSEFIDNEKYYFSLLSDGFCNLLNLWSDIRKRYLYLHGWYNINLKFFVGPQRSQMKEVIKGMMDLKVLMDTCMEMVDSHGYWLSKKMNELGAYLIINSMKQFLQQTMNETRKVQKSMKKLIFEFCRMEEHLKTLSARLVTEFLELTNEGNSTSQQSSESSSNLNLANQVGPD